jgi:hypothetical protein
MPRKKKLLRAAWTNTLKGATAERKNEALSIK